jgi:hypothetical protein
MYLFALRNGKKKLSYGRTPEDALDVLRIRLTDAEMAEIIADQWLEIEQRELQRYVPELG